MALYFQLVGGLGTVHSCTAGAFEVLALRFARPVAHSGYIVVTMEVQFALDHSEDLVLAPLHILLDSSYIAAVHEEVDALVGDVLEYEVLEADAALVVVRFAGVLAGAVLGAVPDCVPYTVAGHFG